jgi:hypothetical protein
MNRHPIWMVSCLLFLALSGCVAGSPGAAEAKATAVPVTPTAVPATPKAAPAPPTSPPAGSGSGLADVVSVEVSGDPSAYRFRVAVRSPDTGCEQYADWWEVVGEEGALIYRRVLLHSHAGEQPFERAGSPVPIEEDRVVYVRAHMHPGGYGGAALKGSVQAGFAPADLAADFAAGLAEKEPLPQGCAF